MIVEPWEQQDADEWDAFTARCDMATFLHSREFLGYHGDRFVDRSVVIRDERGHLVGVMPAAERPGEPEVVMSHPGATFGGLVHDGTLKGLEMLCALEGVAEHFRDGGFQRLRYAAVPSIYHRQPATDDLYALFRLGATRSRCDLSCAIDMEAGPRLSSRRRRGLSKARRAGLELDEGSALLPKIHRLIESNLASRHAARPVHSLPELMLLAARFPDAIDAVLARDGGEVVAGVVLFDSARVSHAQYIASNDRGNAVGALDLVFARCFARAAERDCRYFDFGTSNRDDGRTLNGGLYEFKAQFGGGGAVYEHYELELSAATPKPVSP